MVPALLLLGDRLVTAHLSRAVAEHLKWCDRNGVTPPPELTLLLGALEASKGQQGSALATSAKVIEPLAVGYEEAAMRLSVSLRTVKRMVADGRLSAFRAGRRRMISVVDLVALTQGEGARDDDDGRSPGDGSSLAG